MSSSSWDMRMCCELPPGCLDAGLRWEGGECLCCDVSAAERRARVLKLKALPLLTDGPK